MFLEKGTTCKRSGAQGEFFVFHKVKKSGNSQKTELRFDLLGKNEQGQSVKMTVDHIIPLGKNGRNVLKNKQILCWECNNKKADHLD